MRILMVCLGNICRSPLAEGILKRKIKESGLDWEVDSAGTGQWHVGEAPDPRSVEVARKYGVDITYQRARQFDRRDFDHFDLILAMDQSNYRDVLRLAQSGEEERKVKMILNYVEPAADRSVPDPYWDDDGFEQVFHMLDEACGQLVERHSNMVS